MFEFHGWAVLRITPGDIENLAEEDRLESALASALRCELEKLDQFLMRYELTDSLNGCTTLIITGCRNHRQAWVIDLFQWIAEHGPGSYGLLYIWDDEDFRYGDGNEFRVWRLARGTLTEQADPFLSPCIPTVEDPYEPQKD